MATNKKGGSKKDSNLGVAVGLGAVAAAVGAYFMYGSKRAAKNRKAVKSWMFKAKAEVLEALENTEDITKKEYEKLIDTISGSYTNIQNATKSDLAAFKKEMKEHWQEIAKTASPKKATSKTRKAVKKVTKKATKGAAKKVKKVADKVSKAAEKTAS